MTFKALRGRHKRGQIQLRFHLAFPKPASLGNFEALSKGRHMRNALLLIVLGLTSQAHANFVNPNRTVWSPSGGPSTWPSNSCRITEHGAYGQKCHRNFRRTKKVVYVKAAANKPEAVLIDGTPFAVCKDPLHTDTDGDGWGWENNQSCVVR